MSQWRNDVREIGPRLRVVEWNMARDPETLGEAENAWWSTLVIEQDLDGPLAGWRAVIEFRMEDTGVVTRPAPPRIVEVRFRPDVPALWSELPTQRALRAVHLGSVLTQVRDWLGSVPMKHTARVWIDAIERGRRSGARGKSDAYYALWARRRVEAQEADPRRPIQWLSVRYGETVGAVNMLVLRAREHGFLEGKPPRLTAKAEEMLDEGDE